MFTTGTRVVLASAVTLASLVPIDAQPASGLAARMDAYLRPFVETNNLSGALLVTRRGEVLYQKAAGLSQPAFSQPNTPDTRFHIASISKVLTAVSILLLEDRGRLRTSDTVSKFIPDYPNGEKIRLEHLLVHNSGIPNVDEFPGPDRYRRYTATDVVAAFRSKPLDFEPGVRFRYSNSDYNLLGLIVEKVSGRRFGDFLAAEVLAPLKLASTQDDDDATRVIPNLAAGTEPDGLRGVKLVPYLAWSTKVGAGGVVSTTGDLCRLADGLFGGTFLSAASVDKILRAEGVFPYGWTDRERAGRKLKGSGGRSPGFISNLEYFLDDGTCVAILTNSYSSVGQVIAADVSAIAAGQSVAPPPIDYAKPRAGELSAFTGRFQLPDNYYSPGATLEMRDHGDHLEAEWSNGVVGFVYPTGKDDFVDRTYWAMVHFIRDAGGRVTGFRYRLLEDFIARKLPS
jgi:CubicO group peptidase (beta-lactamase class C family)